MTAGSGGGASGGSVARPTKIRTRPVACSMRCGCGAVRSSTTRVTSGVTLLMAARTRMTRGSAARARPAVLVLTPGKSRKMRGGPSTVPTVGAGSGPLASTVTRTSLPTCDDVIRCTTVGRICAAADCTAARHIATATTSETRAGRAPGELLDTADFIFRNPRLPPTAARVQNLIHGGPRGPHLVPLVTPQAAFNPTRTREIVKFRNESAKSRARVWRQTNCDCTHPRALRVATNRPARPRRPVADCPPLRRAGGCRDARPDLVRGADARPAACHVARSRRAPGRRPGGDSSVARRRAVAPFELTALSVYDPAP